MKKLGFGLMRLPKINNENDKIDIETMKEMVDYFIDQGFTYFDTAWFYHDEKSEGAMKETLVDRYPRDKYIVADKMPVAILDEKDKSEEELREDLEYHFNTQLERTGLEYFDYYLLHSLDKVKFERAKTYKAYDFLLEMKDQGLIKRAGFSFHDTADVLEEIFNEFPELDFVQLQINYLDWDHEKIQSREIYELAKKNNKDIIVMEPIKGGTLANLPQEAEKIMEDYAADMSIASWAIRFAAGLDKVFMVLSGMSNMEQMIDNTSYMKDFKPLNNKEVEIINEVREIVKESTHIQCTECEYCLNDCPSEIPIPTYFSLYNRDKQGLGSGHKKRYEDTIEKKSPPSACIQCGNCESICPQHLEIISLLEEVEEYFEAK